MRTSTSGCRAVKPASLGISHRPAKPGVVVTIEPGIYVIDLLLKTARNDKRRDLIDWTQVEALRPYGGIRIEDDVVATGGAPENLTRDAFAQAAA